MRYIQKLRVSRYNCVVITVFLIIEFSVVLTLVTGEATTSCDTNHGDNLLKDGVTAGEEEAPSVLSVGLYKQNNSKTKL